jgi:2-iminobutanoate/2-iminopropanoate deaminase
MAAVLLPQHSESIPVATKIRIQTNAAPPALGTYSQAIRTGDLVFVTGQTGRHPETGKLEEGLEAQTRRLLENIDAILNAAGCTNADIVKVTLLLADIKDFKAVDQIYAAWLPGHGVTPAKPARTAFQAAALPAGALVMLEVVAAYPDSTR